MDQKNINFREKEKEKKSSLTVEHPELLSNFLQT